MPHFARCTSDMFCIASRSPQQLIRNSQTTRLPLLNQRLPLLLHSSSDQLFRPNLHWVNKILEST